jgi:hypothetical protein
VLSQLICTYHGCLVEMQCIAMSSWVLPALPSMVLHWSFQVSHGGSIYTRNIGKLCQSPSKSPGEPVVKHLAVHFCLSPFRLIYYFSIYCLRPAKCEISWLRSTILKGPLSSNGSKKAVSKGLVCCLCSPGWNDAEIVSTSWNSYQHQKASTTRKVLIYLFFYQVAKSFCSSHLFY